MRPFPGPGRAIPISTNGGFEPLWSRDGKELFYREGDALKAVTFRQSDPLAPGETATVLEGKYARAPYGGRQANHNVSLDGQRVLFVRRKNLPQPTTIQVVLNWPAALWGR